MRAPDDSNVTTHLLSSDRPQDVASAVRLLQAGKLVAMPTETVYGLAANALDPEAVASIFSAKKRPGWDPLIVHVCDDALLRQVVRDVSPLAQRLMDAFWPGPLTLLLPRSAVLPEAVTAGRDLVGVRMPAHPVALHLIRAARVPLAAPSANLFGHISPTTAQHVLDDLRGRIHAVLNAGACAVGVESTVLDPAAMVLYRQGGVAAREIESVAGRGVTVYQVPADATVPASLPSPGVGVRHYAPRARLVLVPDEASMHHALRDLDPATTGVMQPKGWGRDWTCSKYAWGRWDDLPALARTLYDGLRTLDAAGVATIVCPQPAAGTASLAMALRDRLEKAARPAVGPSC